eukprot:2781977-Rhodomonas_salina.1
MLLDAAGGCAERVARCVGYSCTQVPASSTERTHGRGFEHAKLERSIMQRRAKESGFCSAAATCSEASYECCAEQGRSTLLRVTHTCAAALGCLHPPKVTVMTREGVPALQSTTFTSSDATFRADAHAHAA